MPSQRAPEDAATELDVESSNCALHAALEGAAQSWVRTQDQGRGVT